MDQTSSAADEHHKKTIRPPRFLSLGFASIITFIGLIAVFGLIRTQALQERLESVVDRDNYRSSLLRTMRITARERMTVLHSAANTTDPFESEELMTRFGAHGEAFLKSRESLLAEDLDDWEREFIDQHRLHAVNIAPRQREAMNLIIEGRLEEARGLMVQVVEPGQARALTHLDAYLDRLNERSQLALAEARALGARTVTLLGLLATLGIIASLVIAARVRTRLRTMLEALNAAQENLEHKVAERTLELQQAHDELDRLAHYDTLTGLPNRRLFYETLNLFLPRARRHAHFAALLFIDLDGFKGVNDKHGHDYGDELLRQVADRLRTCMRAEDLVARLGGDEFTIILGDMQDPDAAEIVARKVIDSLQAPFDVLGQSVEIGSSIGIALFPTHAQDRDGLIKAADDMMYAVKRAGKNNFRVYSDELRANGEPDTRH